MKDVADHVLFNCRKGSREVRYAQNFAEKGGWVG
jgi:hypothetical protein